MKLIEGVSKGGYGTVMKVENTVNKKIYAMKVIKKSFKTSNSLMIELYGMKNISSHGENNDGKNHPFLQEFYGAFESKNNVFILSEFISGGDCFYHLSTRSFSFTENQVRIILAELFLALEYLHSVLKLLHCDIKVCKK